jgi:hypothetical protein
MREAATRLGASALASVVMAVLLLGILWRVVRGPAGYRMEIARGLSRTLNAITDGDGDTTFSAQSYENLLLGLPGAERRVRLVDALPGTGPGHCQRAWEWHAAHGLTGAREASGDVMEAGTY